MFIIALIILTVINLVIFHSMFSVFYFDLAKGIGKEIFVSFLVAIVEAALICFLGPYIIAAIVIIVVILAIIIFIAWIISTSKKKGKNKSNVGNKDTVFETVKTIEENKVPTQTITTESEPVALNHEEKKQFCVYCGKEISRHSKFCNFCGKENKRRINA